MGELHDFAKFYSDGAPFCGPSDHWSSANNSRGNLGNGSKLNIAGVESSFISG